MRVSSYCFAILLLTFTLSAQDADPGRIVFEGRCARCHGADGNGGELGPAIRGRLAARNDQQLVTLIRAGLPGQGMPPSQISDAEMEPLTRFLRTLQPRNFRRPVVREKVVTTDGKTLDGEVLNQGLRRHATAHRRQPCAPVAPRRRQVSRGHVEHRLARL